MHELNRAQGGAECSINQPETGSKCIQIRCYTKEPCINCFVMVEENIMANKDNKPVLTKLRLCIHQRNSSNKTFGWLEQVRHFDGHVVLKLFIVTSRKPQQCLQLYLYK